MLSTTGLAMNNGLDDSLLPVDVSVTQGENFSLIPALRFVVYPLFVRGSRKRSIRERNVSLNARQILLTAKVVNRLRVRKKTARLDKLF